MSWVLNWVEWYLDEDGFPDPSKVGAIRYFVVVDGSPVFHATREWLIENYPEQCYAFNPNTGENILVPPKSFTCILANIFDNPALIESNPNYLAELKALPEIERARLLDGNWYVRPQGSNYFERGWLTKVDNIPINSARCRAWDKASSEPSEVERKPDFTASVGMAKDKDGFYYIYGGYSQDQKDPESEVFGKFRKRPGERDILIKNQALFDGSDIHQVLPVDPGAAGKVEYQESSKKLISEGVVVKSDPMPGNKSKLKRFEPFSSAAQNGLVRIVESSFINKKTLEAFYKELESFNGERSTRERKDDWADACASAFNYINEAKVIPPFTLPQLNANSRYREVMNSPIPTFGNKLKSLKGDTIG